MSPVKDLNKFDAVQEPFYNPIDTASSTKGEEIFTGGIGSGADHDNLTITLAADLYADASLLPYSEGLTVEITDDPDGYEPAVRSARTSSQPEVDETLVRTQQIDKDTSLVGAASCGLCVTEPERGSGQIFGDHNDNVIRGTVKPDTIYGGCGADNIRGDRGQDLIYGDSGADNIQGNAGEDQIYGGDGDDVLYGNRDDDFIFGGAGNDTIYGGNNDDWIFGGDGDDTLYADNGYDSFVFDLDDGTDEVINFDEGDQIVFNDGIAYNDLQIIVTGSTATVTAGDTVINFVNLSADLDVSDFVFY